MTANALIIQIKIIILTCYVVSFKPAGKIKYTEAPVLLQLFEQQHTSVCEGTESSETQHGQDTLQFFSIVLYSPFMASFYTDIRKLY